MKRIKIFLLLFAIAFSSHAQLDTIWRKSPGGKRYIADINDTAKITIIYFAGSGQRGNTYADLNKMTQVTFWQLYLNFKNDYNWLWPQQNLSRAGWETRINSFTEGANFVREMKIRYNLRRVIVTGHSMGATWETPADLQKEIIGFMPVAGRHLSQNKVVQMGKYRIPVSGWHGKLDTNTTNNPNTITNGRKAINAYKLGGGLPEWNELDGVAHGSDVVAYKVTTVAGVKTTPLVTWIKKLFPPPIVTPGIYVNGVYAGTDSVTVSGSLITLVK